METAEKTIEATEEVGAVSVSPSTSLLAELFSDLKRIDETSILPDGDWVSVCVATWAAEWVTRLKNGGERHAQPGRDAAQAGRGRDDARRVAVPGCGGWIMAAHVDSPNAGGHDASKAS